MDAEARKRCVIAYPMGLHDGESECACRMCGRIGAETWQDQDSHRRTKERHARSHAARFIVRFQSLCTWPSMGASRKWLRALKSEWKDVVDLWSWGPLTTVVERCTTRRAPMIGPERPKCGQHGFAEISPQTGGVLREDARAWRAPRSAFWFCTLVPRL
jgi:hypothetical protein